MLCRSILIVVILFVSFQHAEPKANIKDLDASLTVFHEERALSDVWNNIKESAKNLWISIKSFAQHSKEKVKKWMENVKIQASITKEKLKERVKNIREKSRAALEKLVGTGKLVKQCIKNENSAVNEILKQIIKNVSKCISDNIIDIGNLNKFESQLNLNETSFMQETEKKINECIGAKNIEECLQNVRSDMYSTVADMENEVLSSELETRGLVDDVLNKILFCSLKGVIDATDVIADESIKIIACVKNNNASNTNNLHKETYE